MAIRLLTCVSFFFNDTATTEIYTLSLHDALPIYGTEYMHVFTAVLEPGYELPITGCDEGELSWVSLADIRKLPVWEGDLLMFDCLFGSRSFFTLKLTYDGSRLAGHNVKL